jgi:hypothetical protein
MQTRLRIYLVIFFLPEWSVYIGDVYFAGVLFIKLSLTIDLFIFSSSYFFWSRGLHSVLCTYQSATHPYFDITGHFVVPLFLWSSYSSFYELHFRSLALSLRLSIYLYLSINSILCLIVSFVNNNESWSSKAHATHSSIYLGRSKNDILETIIDSGHVRSR